MVAYNYKRFRAKDYPFGTPLGVARGAVIEGELYDLDDRVVDIALFRGRPLVIETGSISCSIYTSKIDWMNEIADAYPEVTFAVLYTREAHPGGRVAPHATQADKRRMAEVTTREMGERRPIWIDDLAGTLHRRLGAFPNMAFVLDAEGAVVYRARWNDPEQLDEVLSALVANEPLPHDESVRLVLPPADSWRNFSRGGASAVFDFALSLPRLFFLNLQNRFKKPVRRPPRGGAPRR